MSEPSDIPPYTDEGDFRDAFVESIFTSTATVGWIDEDTGEEAVKHLLEVRFFRADKQVVYVLMPAECILALMEAFPAVLTRYFDGNLSTRIDIPDSPASIDWNRGGGIPMSNSTGGFIDLSLLRDDNDVAAGVQFKAAIYNTTVQTEQGDMQVQMPVFDLTFHMANGRVNHRISISPDMVLAMIANMAGWRLALDGIQQ